MLKKIHRHIIFQPIPDTPRGNGRETNKGVEVVCDGLQFNEQESRHYCIFTGSSCGYKTLINCGDFRNHILPIWQKQGKYLLDQVSASAHNYK